MYESLLESVLDYRDAVNDTVNEYLHSHRLA